MNNILNLKNIRHSYKTNTVITPVLKGLELMVENGESIAILGQSGCGKSTLLNIMGGIDKPDNGEVRIYKTDLNGLNEDKITQLRAQYLGFVYQFHHLLKDFSALKNVMMPLLIQGLDAHLAEQKSIKLLDEIGLQNRIHHRPAELSGGERQRVAVARALINQPKCLLADEPTGNLDAHNADEVLDLMITLNQSQNSALVIVTHDEKIAKKMQRVLVLADGKLQ